MAEFKYAVVVFTDENRVGIVCYDWLIEGGKATYWPTHNMTNCLLKNKTPTDDWVIYTCRVLSKASDYKQAKRRLKRAETGSQLSSDEPIRARSSSHLNESDVSSDEDRPKKKSRVPSALLEAKKSQERAGPSRLSSSILVESDDDLHGVAAISNSIQRPTLSTLSNSPGLRKIDKFDYVTKVEFEAFQRKHFQMLHEIKESLDTIIEYNRNISGALIVPSASEALPPNAPHFPLSSEAEVLALEQWLLVPDNQALLLNYLAVLGGKSIEDATRRVLSHILTRQMALTFNWAGRGGKVGFSTLKLKDVVIGAVIRFKTKDVSVSVVEETIKMWFKSARYRVPKVNVNPMPQ